MSAESRPTPSPDRSRLPTSDYVSALPPQHNDDGDFVPLPSALVFGAANGTRPGPQRRLLSSTDLQADSWRLLNPVEDFVIGPITLTFDGQQWKVRTCGLDMRAEGSAGGTSTSPLYGSSSRIPILALPPSTSLTQHHGLSSSDHVQPSTARARPWFCKARSDQALGPSVTRCPPATGAIPAKWNEAGKPRPGGHPLRLRSLVRLRPPRLPQDALDESDWLIAGEIVGSQWASAPLATMSAWNWKLRCVRSFPDRSTTSIRINA